jgi:rare lipoprotein A
VRLQPVLRAPTARGLVGVSGTVITLVAGASAAAQSDTPGASVAAAVKDATLSYGQPLIVRGAVASGEAGVPVTLEFRPAGAPEWRPAVSSATRAGGRYALAAQLRRSGAVRVVSGGATARAATAPDAPLSSASAEREIRVGAALVARHVRRHLMAGNAMKVSGAVRPGGAGRVVVLQLRRGGRWRTVDRDHTAPSGAFRLRQRLTSAMSLPARVRFAGDSANAPARRFLGRVNSYRRAYASWYGPGLYGNRLGCGGVLGTGTVGVAHKTLPCGTMLTLRYHGRTVRAPVIDRGPYVGGREFDLTAATSARLGFHGHGWLSVTV